MTAGLAPTANAIERIASECGQDNARWAFTQWELRRKAKNKFEKAHEMLFEKDALEMATHEKIAAFHASRFEKGELVADLTSGIGSDLIALAKRGPAIGFELNQERRSCTFHNLMVNGLEADLRGTDCLAADWKFKAAFADPERRYSGIRTVNPDDFEPNPAVLIKKMKRLRLGGLKLSPMLPDEYLESFGGRLEFVSYGRECREALIWVGKEARKGRCAVHVETGDVLPSGSISETRQTPLKYLFDADPAAIRAHALGTLCIRHSLHQLGDTNGYLTGSKNPKSPWLRAYEVVYKGKGDIKTTRRKLKELKAKVIEVKTRGKTPHAESIRREFKPEGKTQLTLAVWPVGYSLQHTLLKRI